MLLLRTCHHFVLENSLSICFGKHSTTPQRLSLFTPSSSLCNIHGAAPPLCTRKGLAFGMYHPAACGPGIVQGSCTRNPVGSMRAERVGRELRGRRQRLGPLGLTLAEAVGGSPIGTVRDMEGGASGTGHLPSFPTAGPSLQLCSPLC